MLLNEEFIKAYESYSDAIFRYCYFRVYDRERAKDIVQETFMKTWDYIARGNDIDNIRAFLYKVARNIIIDYTRKKKEDSLEALQESGFNPGVDERANKEIEFDFQAALQAIKSLDEKYREAVTMRYIEGYSPKEIAKMIDETENVISVRIHRGLQQLRKKIKYV